MAMTNALEQSVLNHVFAQMSLSYPSNVYLGLFTTLPDDDGTGGTEFTNYDGIRKAMKASMGTASGGTISNTAAFQFENFGVEATIVGVGVWTAATGGTLWWYGPLTANKTVAAGDSLQFPVGALTFTLD